MKNYPFTVRVQELNSMWQNEIDIAKITNERDVARARIDELLEHARRLESEHDASRTEVAELKKQVARHLAVIAFLEDDVKTARDLLERWYGEVPGDDLEHKTEEWLWSKLCGWQD